MQAAWNGGKGPSWSAQKHFNSGKVGRRANRAGKGQWFKTEGKEGGTGQETGGKGDTRVCWRCGKTGHIAANCTEGSWNKCLNAVEEDKGDICEEVHEDEDELRAWCLLEESENEQWQEVISKKSKLKTKKLAHESLLSVEHNSCASPRKVIEVKDNWVKIRATVDTGDAGHVMPAEMFPRVNLDRTSATKKFVAANGERIKYMGEKTIPFKSVEGVHRCIKFRSANVVKPLTSMRKVVQSWQCRGAWMKTIRTCETIEMAQSSSCA